MLEQWYKEAFDRGWCTSTFDQYKLAVWRRACILSGEIIPIDQLEDYLKDVNVNNVMY